MMYAIISILIFAVAFFQMRASDAQRSLEESIRKRYELESIIESLRRELKQK
jgi:hypothetical protein